MLGDGDDVEAALATEQDEIARRNDAVRKARVRVEVALQYTTADEERVRRMAEEVRSALDELPRLAGSLGLSIDVGRVGHLGRAFGGAVGVAAALADDRIAATANLGGILVGEPAATARPYLQLNHDAVADLNRDYCARTAGPAYLAHIAGTGSTSFSDTPYLPWLEHPPARFFGVIDRDHGVFVFPDTNAHFQGEKPQHVYSVRFAARELWGEQAAPNDSVYVDMWDDYLEPA